MFPTPLAILIYCAPESPWWLVRKGRLEEAAHAVGRLGRRSRSNPKETVAMMRRVVELETSDKEPSHFELFKGTDLYRTLIVCCVYLAQNLTGNLIANQAVYFFERELFPSFTEIFSLISKCRGRSISQHRLRTGTHHLRSPNDLRYALLDPHHLLWSPHHLPLGLRRQRLLAGHARSRCLRWEIQCCFSGSSQFGTDYFGAVYAGSGACVLGHHWRDISYSSQTPHDWYGSCFVLHRRNPLHFLGELYAQPHCTSSPPPPPFTSIQLLTQLPQGGNLGGKCGYVWGGTGLVCLVTAFWYLPEMKGRSYREIDILFKRNVPARKWKSTVVDVQDDE